MRPSMTPTLAASAICLLLISTQLYLGTQAELSKDELKFFNYVYKDLAPSKSWPYNFSSIVLIETTGPDCPSQHGTMNDLASNLNNISSCAESMGPG